MLTLEEKALIIIDLLNKDTPHGLGRDDWIKKHPGSQGVIVATKGKGKNSRSAKEFEAKMKYVAQSGPSGESSRTSSDMGYETRGSGLYRDGGADYKVEFGNNQEYPIAPLQNLPYTAHTDPSTGASIIAEDKDLVNTALPRNEFLREEGKILSKKGRSGFIKDASPTLPYVQKEGYRAPETIVLDQKQLTQLNSKHKKIVTPGKELAESDVRVRTSKTPRTKTSKGGVSKGGKGRAPTAGSEFLGSWRAFCDKLKKEPFMGGKANRESCSLVYELMNDIKKSKNMGGFDRSLIVGKLNQVSEGSELTPSDVSKYLKGFRTQLHSDDKSIPLVSLKELERKKKASKIN